MKILLASLALVSTSLFAAPKEKVNVCHFSGDEGTFKLLNIAQPAVQAHLRHGDVLAPGAGLTVQAQLSTGVIITLDAACSVVVTAG